jgi:D-alanine transaminase
MARIAYVNGGFRPLEEAAVSVEDRGFQFADGVYEVIALIDGALADERGHLDRLWRSMGELSLPPPVSRAILARLIRETVRRNRLRDALVYIQVTRGPAPRAFTFPKDARPSLVITVRRHDFTAGGKAETGIPAVTLPDLRWARRDIKTVALLPQALAKQAAAEKGAGEALLVDKEGFITEGASSNFWIVTRKGELVTRKADHDILKGVTRTALLALPEAKKLRLVQRPVSPRQAYGAAEAFISGAGALVQPVVEIDGRRIGNGKPGPVTRALRKAYLAYAASGAQEAWTE